MQHSHIENEFQGFRRLKSNLMNLTFFNKILIRIAQRRPGLVETFLCEMETVRYIDKVYHITINENNNTCISGVFNGFKYTTI